MLLHVEHSWLRKMHPRAAIIYAYIRANVGADGMLRITKREIAFQCGIAESTFARDLRFLQRRNIIIHNSRWMSYQAMPSSEWQS